MPSHHIRVVIRLQLGTEPHINCYLVSETAGLFRREGIFHISFAQVFDWPVKLSYS